MKNDTYNDFELKIVAQSNIEAIKTIEKLFPEFKFKELKVTNSYDFRKANVYTIRIHGLASKSKHKK